MQSRDHRSWSTAGWPEVECPYRVNIHRTDGGIWLSYGITDMIWGSNPRKWKGWPASSETSEWLAGGTAAIIQLILHFTSDLLEARRINWGPRVRWNCYSDVMSSCISVEPLWELQPRNLRAKWWHSKARHGWNKWGAKLSLNLTRNDATIQRVSPMRLKESARLMMSSRSCEDTIKILSIIKLPQHVISILSLPNSSALLLKDIKLQLGRKCLGLQQMVHAPSSNLLSHKLRDDDNQLRQCTSFHLITSLAEVSIQGN